MAKLKKKIGLFTLEIIHLLFKFSLQIRAASVDKNGYYLSLTKYVRVDIPHLPPTRHRTFMDPNERETKYIKHLLSPGLLHSRWTLDHPHTNEQDNKYLLVFLLKIFRSWQNSIGNNTSFKTNYKPSTIIIPSSLSLPSVSFDLFINLNFGISFNVIRFEQFISI